MLLTLNTGMRPVQLVPRTQVPDASDTITRSTDSDRWVYINTVCNMFRTSLHKLQLVGVEGALTLPAHTRLLHQHCLQNK